MRNIKYMVIHHSAVDQPDLNKLINSMNINHKKRKLHTSLNRLGYYIAYHYVIGVDGTIKDTRDINEIGNHASNYTVNKEGIGVCLSGNLDTHAPTDAQIASLINLITLFKKSYDISVVYHRDYVNKSCPGKKFPYALFSKKIEMISKFKSVFENEVKDPIFDIHSDNSPATIADVKYLMEIGIARANKKIVAYIDKENKTDRSFISRIFSYLKI